jgi:hypothetical protein
MDASLSMRIDWILLSTDFYLMGQWRNGGILRKTIVRGIVMTIRQDSLEGMNGRRRRFYRAHSCALFNLARLVRILHRTTDGIVCLA